MIDGFEVAVPSTSVSIPQVIECVTDYSRPFEEQRLMYEPSKNYLLNDVDKILTAPLLCSTDIFQSPHCHKQNRDDTLLIASPK
jgi:hypothetical protein